MRTPFLSSNLFNLWKIQKLNHGSTLATRSSGTAFQYSKNKLVLFSSTFLHHHIYGASINISSTFHHQSVICGAVIVVTQLPSLYTSHPARSERIDPSEEWPRVLRLPPSEHWNSGAPEIGCIAKWTLCICNKSVTRESCTNIACG